MPVELKHNSEYKYLFNIIDHTSKYVGSFLLENKKGESILKCIKNFFDDVGYPIEMAFDNGKEFINSALTNYLNEKNIRIIKGKPYHPKSQGVCERIHRTIRKGLIIKYIENRNKFDLVTELNNVVKEYNRTTHTVTKYTPIEIFYSTNKLLLDEVYKNTVDYYVKNQKDAISYIKGEKCLLINNIIISKKKYDKKYIILEKNRIKNNKSFLKISYLSIAIIIFLNFLVYLYIS